MPLSASEAEATALGAAAAAGAALKEHEKTCLECSRARKARKPDQCCDTGYAMVRTVHKANQLIATVRKDRAEARKLQRGLW